MSGLLEGVFGAVGQGFTSWLGKEKARSATKKKKAQAESLNWDPVYASDLAPTYQKTESPVARSYLESFLLGNNPDATFSGSPNAGAVKSTQQTSQNAMFGTPEARQARQQQLMSETPWAVTKRPEDVVNERFAAESPNAGAAGLNPEIVQDIFARTGINIYRNGVQDAAIGADGAARIMEAYKAGDDKQLKKAVQAETAAKKDNNKAGLSQREQDEYIRDLFTGKRK
jgi:hypothetical protein